MVVTALVAAFMFTTSGPVLAKKKGCDSFHYFCMKDCKGIFLKYDRENCFRQCNQALLNCVNSSTGTSKNAAPTNPTGTP